MKVQPRWAKRLCGSGLAASVIVAALSAPVLADPPGGRFSDRGDPGRAGEGWDDRGGKQKREERRDDHGGKQKREEQRDRERRDDRDQHRDRDVRDWPRERDRRPDYSEQRRKEGYDPEPWEHLYPPGYRSGDRYRDRDYHKPLPRTFYRSGPRVVPRERTRWYRDVVIVRPHGHWYPGYAHYHRDDDAYKWLAFTAITLGVLDYLNEVQQREHEAAQVSATTAPVGERIYWQEGGASGYVVATREGTTASGRYCREFQHQVSIGGRTEDAYGTACRNPDGSWEVVAAE